MGIPFNIPCSLGIEPDLIREAIANRHLSGNGPFTKQVHRIFEAEMGFRQVLLTHSCTGALEMAGLLARLGPGDEVILPSFTHVGTANALERTGATLKFADSLPNHPNIDPEEIERLWSPRTKAVVVVHYAGVACRLEEIQQTVGSRGGMLIEDAAHAIGATYKGQLLGSFGDLSAYSFHETKNLTCGQGGLLMVNAAQYGDRALKIWENGTNRSAFYRGETDHYSWVDRGGCYLPPDLTAAYLYGQLRHREEIFQRRIHLWNQYNASLIETSQKGHFDLPLLEKDGAHNGHIFYLRLPTRRMRDALLNHLRDSGIGAVFHYIPLHSSPYFRGNYEGPDLKNCRHHSDTLLRLPLYFGLEEDQLSLICDEVRGFFHS